MDCLKGLVAQRVQDTSTRFRAENTGATQQSEERQWKAERGAAVGNYGEGSVSGVRRPARRV